MSRLGTGRATRFGIALQVGFAILLALAALGAVNYLASRPGLRQRFDLTEKGNNTLSTATRGVLSQVTEPIEIDVFYRTLAGPLGPLQDQVMERIQRMLVLMESENELLQLRYNDVSDRIALDERRNQLRLMGFENCVVVSTQERREVLRLGGDLAEFDPGNPGAEGFRPASVRVFRAEERIVQGILEVLKNASPKLYFTGGHGELDPFDQEDPGSLGNLSKALVEDGFEVEWWRYDVDGPVPEDCDVLATVGPTSPFTEDEQAAVRAYLEEGGRWIVAPPGDVGDLDRSGLVDWLAAWNIDLSRGIVCAPAYVDGRIVVGRLENLAMQLGPENMAQHSITRPLREGGRYVRMYAARRVQVALQPKQGASLPLLQSNPASWLDLPDSEGAFDYRPDVDNEVVQRPQTLAVVSEFETEATLASVGALEEDPKARLAVLGSSYVFNNQLIDFNLDFARNLFNWAVDREYRVAISPRDPDQRRLPITRSDALTRVAWISLWGLPGLCALAGGILAILRSRSGRAPSNAVSS